MLVALMQAWTQPALARPGCAGNPATIVGTGDNDRIRGTPARDVIVGLGGQDRILGRGGNDVLCGGRRKDWLSGGSGDDRLYGGEASDWHLGWKGNDVLVGAAGNDPLVGDTGHDVLLGQRGADVLDPGRGNDMAIADVGDDSVEVGRGQDRYEGGEGEDYLEFYGFNGGLVIDLAAGTATGEGIEHLITGFEDVLAGRGPDTIIGNGADNWIYPDGGSDAIDGGPGRDIVDYSWVTYLEHGVTVDLPAGIASYPQGSDTLTRIEDIRGSENSDVLLGDDADNHLFGTGGGDRFEGRAGDDTLDGTAYTYEAEGDDIGDGGPHNAGDTCVDIEQPMNCEIVKESRRPARRR